MFKLENFYGTIISEQRTFSQHHMDLKFIKVCLSRSLNASVWVSTTLNANVLFQFAVRSQQLEKNYNNVLDVMKFKINLDNCF